MTDKEIVSVCPLEGYSGFLRNRIQPRCFHCGQFYRLDRQHSSDSFNVFMPVCVCLNKSASIRVIVDKK